MTAAADVAAAGSTAVSTPDGRVGGVLHRAAVAAGAPLVLCVHGSGCHGGYFDLSGNSLAAAAQAGGMPVLLLDRPGYGASAPPAPGSAIDRSVEALDGLLGAARALDRDLVDRPLALVGHSFGGAVALSYAAQAGAGDVAAVCISGIGDQPEPSYAAAAAAGKPAPYWLFGPGSSYDWRGITALRAAAAPWRREEVAEIVEAWPARWSAVAAAVTCPVHLRLAEYERIWQTTPAAIDRIARTFRRAPVVDAAIAAAGGHLYEAHLRGPELVAAQLAFVRAMAAAR